MQKKQRPIPEPSRSYGHSSAGVGGILGVLQPVYLPWLGYFEQIAVADQFVLLDDVQYTKQDWRNRNRVKTAQGATWITVPVRRHPLKTQLNAVEIANEHPWSRRHLRTIEQSYSRCPFLRPLFDDIARIFDHGYHRLVELNVALIHLLCGHLEIDTPIFVASEISGINPPGGDPSDRLIELCGHFQARVLYEGASGIDYLDLRSFRRAEIDVAFQDYRHPSYPQVHGDFISHLSAIDLIMNVGPDAPRVLRSSPVRAALTAKGTGCAPSPASESTR